MKNPATRRPRMLLKSRVLHSYFHAWIRLAMPQMGDIQIGNSRVFLSPHLIRLIRMRNALASVINIFYMELDRKNPNFGNKTTVVKSVSGWSIQRVIFLKLGFDYSILAKNGLFNAEYDGEKRKNMARRVYFESNWCQEFDLFAQYLSSFIPYIFIVMPKK